jgi:8-hydroxy-5-deazaflavin:NADPH oxidoreductase
MNFGVIGPGDIGEVIIRKLRDAGYPVKMANSRGPESLKDLATKREEYRLHLNKSFRA